MSKGRCYINIFKPKLERLDSASDAELSLFRAGVGYECFDKYIAFRQENGKTEAEEDRDNGEGTTHLIWDYSGEQRNLVAYFTLASNVIPYDDGIEKEDEFDLSNYPCIPVMELKMFAVSEKYQDTFYLYSGMDMPIAAWCLRTIVGYIDMLSENVFGVKGIFLHAVPSAKQFYRTNGFSLIPSVAKPLYSNDQGYDAMWLPIREVLIPQESE